MRKTQERPTKENQLDDSCDGDPCYAHAARDLDLLLLSSGVGCHLYPRLLEFLVQRAEIDGAWLGHPGANGEIVFDAMAGAGMAAHIGDIDIRLEPLVDAVSPLQLAWQTGLPQFAGDSRCMLPSQPPSEARESAYWQDSVIIPLREVDRVRHLLGLYSRQPGFFSFVRNQCLVHHLYRALTQKVERTGLLNRASHQDEMLQLLKSALDATDVGVSLADARCRDYPLVYVNAAFTRMSGYSDVETLGRNCWFLQGEDAGGEALKEVRAALSEGRGCCVELHNTRADGTGRWNVLTLSPIRDELGVVSHYVGLMSDVTARHVQKLEHETSEELYRALLAEEELVLTATDLSEMLQQACERLTASGLFHAAFIGRAGVQGNVDLLAKAGDLQISEEWYRPRVKGAQANLSLAGRVWNSKRLEFTNDYLNDSALALYRDRLREAGVRSAAVAPVMRGGHRWALLGVVSMQTGIFTPSVLELLERVARLIGHGLDAFDLRRRLQQEHRHISWLAEHDLLTGLLNRRGLQQRLEGTLSHVDAQGGYAAVGILDFDDFQEFNDTYGRAAGDAVLRNIAGRLVESVRSTDIVARLGGDEIALVLQGVGSRDDLHATLARIRKAVETPLLLPGREEATRVRASLGLTIYPDDTSEVDDLLRHAGQALSAMKQQPRGSADPFSRVYIPGTDGDHFNQMRLVRDRVGAGGLRMHYQPVVETLSGRVVEVEALARLDDGHGKWIPPLEFIHQLGRDDLIALTGEVVRLAVHDAQQWQRAVGAELSVAVNVDPLLVASGDVFEIVKEVVSSSKFPANRLVLEILEHSDFLSLSSARESLAALRGLGCRVALDDIGSAYSSLLRVKDLPIDIIKLDQSFIRGLAAHPQDLRFVQSLTQLARGLGVDFVAEGAETDDIVEALRVLRVPQVQGWAIARPMSATQLASWLATWPMSRSTPSRRGLLTRAAEQLVALDADLLIARQYPEWQAQLSMSRGPSDYPIGQWLLHAGLPADHVLVQSHDEFHTMFQEWRAAGPQADDTLIQSALDHLLRNVGAFLRADSDAAPGV